MPIFGLVSALMATLLAYLRGDEATRPFIRRAFAAVVFVEIGAVDLATSTLAMVAGGI